MHKVRAQFRFWLESLVVIQVLTYPRHINYSRPRLLDHWIFWWVPRFPRITTFYPIFPASIRPISPCTNASPNWLLTWLLPFTEPACPDRYSVSTVSRLLRPCWKAASSASGALHNFTVFNLLTNQTRWTELICKYTQSSSHTRLATSRARNYSGKAAIRQSNLFQNGGWKFSAPHYLWRHGKNA